MDVNCSFHLCHPLRYDPSHHESADRVEVRPTFKYHLSLLRVLIIISIINYSVIAELIVGYALPGRPVAMMLFKTWGYITMTQGWSVAHEDARFAELVCVLKR